MGRDEIREAGRAWGALVDSRIDLKCDGGPPEVPEQVWMQSDVSKITSCSIEKKQ